MDDSTEFFADEGTLLPPEGDAIPAEIETFEAAEEPRIPGPGLGESLAWTIGTLVVHLVGGLLMAGYLLATSESTRGLSPEQLAERVGDGEFLQGLMQSRLMDVLAAEQLIFLTFAVLACWLRLGRSKTRALPLDPPAWSHFGLAVLWILPLAVTCLQLGAVANRGWEALVDRFPGLQGMDGGTSMELVSGIATRENLPQLLLWVAVVPAIAEELIFRGVVGRGLVARYGVVWGIGLTSVLFGAVHMHPVHAAALLPLAVAMHVSYLATRSFVLPVLIHFFNNGFAVTMMTLAAPAEGAGAGAAEFGDAAVPWTVAVPAAALSVAIGVLFWQTRVVYRDAEGGEWSPGYAGADAPLRSAEVGMGRARASWGVLSACGLGTALFVAALVLSGEPPAP